MQHIRPLVIIITNNIFKMLINNTDNSMTINTLSPIKCLCVSVCVCIFYVFEFSKSLYSLCVCVCVYFLCVWILYVFLFSKCLYSLCVCILYVFINVCKLREFWSVELWSEDVYLGMHAAGKVFWDDVTWME